MRRRLLEDRTSPARFRHDRAEIKGRSFGLLGLKRAVNERHDTSGSFAFLLNAHPLLCGCVVATRFPRPFAYSLQRDAKGSADDDEQDDTDNHPDDPAKRLGNVGWTGKLGYKPDDECDGYGDYQERDDPREQATATDVQERTKDGE